MSPVRASNRWNLRAPTAVPIAVIRELDYVKVTIKEFVIDGPFVMAFVIDKPDAVQAIRSAVIAHSEYATIVFAKRPAAPCVRDAHN